MSSRAQRNVLRTAKKKPEKRGSLAKVVVAGGLVLFAFLVCFAIFHRSSSVVMSKVENTAGRDTNAKFPIPTVSFGSTVPNKAMLPYDSPRGMVWVTGGEFSMGTQDAADMNDVGMKATVDSRPVHRVYVDGFFMDKTDVTNIEFERFVKQRVM